MEDDRRAHAVESCANRYLYPEPRVRMGLALGRNRVASACMDLSDGLADGVRQIAEASGVGIIVDADAMPVDEQARAWFNARGGDALAQGPLRRRRLRASVHCPPPGGTAGCALPAGVPTWR